MISKIVEQLKTGLVNNVVPFGMSSLPAPPYLVVKMEKDPIGRGTVYRIIGHYSPGQVLFLEDYMKKNVPDLLDGFTATERHGNYQKIDLLDEWSGIVTENDDNTISMERQFLVAGILY